ncbi:unnamed protein product [Lymnaea stagnalis]|uniref:RZ-type domain-containing protein n=1 Tax=Lymnaea stagnalis TaxID=6523 RepID=A0AAV2IIF7_LYMST
MDNNDNPPNAGRHGRQPQAGLRQTGRLLTSNEMEIMLLEKTPAEVLTRISTADGSFEKLLKEKENDMKYVRLMVRVIGFALGDTRRAQEQAVVDLVKMIIDNSSFHEKILYSLQGKQTFDEKYVKAILVILKSTLERIPNVAAKELSLLFMTLERIIDTKYEHLIDEKDEVKELIYRPMKFEDDDQDKEQETLLQDQDVDPNLFRGLSVIPTAADFDPTQDIVLRANKIKGRYENINDYLDIQFRLLRADLLIPLRENIHKFLDGDKKHAVRAYAQVRIVRPICHDKGLCFRLSFDVTKHRRINWSVSQRLKFGSLLCLSSDNFNTYRTAIVENRDPKDLSKGLVDVQFILNTQGPNMDVEELRHFIEEARDQRFVMVESPTYFEAYKYVLLGLQHMTENNFPFWQYIGQCIRQVNPPQYLEDADNPTYDLRPLVDTDYVITENEDLRPGFSPEAAAAEAVKVLDLESWPNPNTFGLDTSQFVALQSALTEEFSIIQGPPGTGKTFIGLMLMKALLHNKKLWVGNDESKPILLVCYTNHALDQFLEGILSFFKGQLVRVGSRSKSERLEEYNLRGLRHRARENRRVPLDIHLAKQQTRIRLNNLKAEIHTEAAKLEILEREIVKESFLIDYIHPDHYKSLTNRNIKGSIITQWLKINLDLEKLEKKRNARAQNRRGQIPNPNRPGGEAAGVDVDAEDEEDMDIIEVLNADARGAEQLEVDNDDIDENEDLFAELQENLGEDFMDSVRNVNKRLDDADKEAIRVKIENTAFNISDYGDEDMPLGLGKREKEHWRSLVPIKRHYRAILLGHLQRTDRMTEEEIRRVPDVWRLNLHHRWRLYRYWVDLYCRKIREEVSEKSQQYEQVARRYQEILHQEDKVILEKATVVGMTTTAAARYQGILREIGPKIVIVEEAAEVLEGHVITSLTDQCQHVVLIGDHKQLRPNPSVFKLKKDYHIDISLFERLVMNDFPLACLREQHRMRPEMTKLLRLPDLYPDLKDHEIVQKYPHILRVRGDVCFIQHCVKDEQENDSRTFSNQYEAMFLIGLCEYLLQQGYTAKQITILSPYAGQIHLIKTLLERLPRSQSTVRKMKGLKISSVDNYQGEENDIILLSLVRSNEANEIGFLKANNRICVALSRAKMGLYVIGNFAGLSEKSDLIREITREAKHLGYLSDHLVLTCLRHKGKETIIREPRDFKNVPEGGCVQVCAIRLDCGHSCKRICHADDLDHKNAMCSQKCQKVCDKCNQYCNGNHKCSQHDGCQRLMRKRIPICGHFQNVPCGMEANQFECQDPCQRILPCGHPCSDKCGRRHAHTEDMCKHTTEVTPKSCGHPKFRIECWKTTEEEYFLCPEPCNVELECGHLCLGSCGKCCGGRLHINCQQKCKKILICGHECRDTCNSCPPCTLPCEVACNHSCCPRQCGAICTPCMELCSWECRHHECVELCSRPCRRPPCDLPCRERLRCGHNCCGLCGEKCPRLCTICDKEELMETSLYGYDGDPTTLFIELDCGHVLEVDFVDQWMTTSTGTNEDSDQQAIGIKTCPLCKTAIRKCTRYGQQIKSMLELIEKVKRKCIGERKHEMELQLFQAIAKARGQEKTEIDRFLQQGDQVLSEIILEAQLTQVNMFHEIFALKRVAEECAGRSENPPAIFRPILTDLNHFSEWILQRRAIFSEQNKQDAEDEIDRLGLLIDLQKIEMNATIRGICNTVLAPYLDKMERCRKFLLRYGKTGKTIIKESKALCERLRELVPDTQLALSYEERMTIIRAVNVSAGAWYSCPNGHIYAIGECGQAMEESKCPDCKAKIGGTNHNLLPNNTWAQDMDGAENPVWRNVNADRDLAERIQRQLNGGL